MAVFTTLILPAFAAISGFIGSLGVVGTALTQLAIGAALTFASTLFAPKSRPFQNPATQYQAVINQASAPRRRAYGRVKLGGVRAFFDSRDGFLYQIVVFHSGEIDAVEARYIGDLFVTVDGSEEVNTPPLGGNVLLRSYLGTADQTADATMTALWSDVWTADHRLRGLAYSFMRFKSPLSELFATIFPEGSNTPLTHVIRASKVLDTRTDTVAWSDNPALILRDYLTHPDGYRRLTADDIDVASFNAFANLCDEAVPLAAGGTEKRYRCSFTYELNDDPKQVVERILATCDGELYTTRQGKQAIRGGKWDVPTVTIAEDDVLAFDLEEGADALDRFNQLKIVYTDPAQDYQPTEADPYNDLADQAERGVQTQDLTIDACPSPTQARRLAKIVIAKSNPRWKGTIRTNMIGHKLRDERTMALVLPELGINETFLIVSRSLTLQDQLPVGYTFEIISLGADAYAWTTAEEGTAPAVPAITAPDLTLAAPSPPTLTVFVNTATILAASVQTPARADLVLEAQIRISSSSIWSAMPVAAGQYFGLSGALVNAETYVVRTRWRGTGGVSDWTAERSIVIDTDGTAPIAPSSFTATVVGSGVSMTWTNPGAHFHATRVYRSADTNFANAVALIDVIGAAGAADTYTDTPGAGTWTYWLKARNALGVESAAAGPLTRTVS